MTGKYSNYNLEQLQELYDTLVRHAFLLEKHQAFKGIETPPWIVIGLEEVHSEVAAVKSAIQRLRPNKKQSYSNLLPSRSLLVGREETLDKILTTIRDEEIKAPIISIEGFGGIGKTSLAIESAHRIIDDEYFDKVIWTTAKREIFFEGELIKASIYLNNFNDLIDQIADAFELDFSDMSSKQKYYSIREKLSSTKTLIFVDNLETVRDSKQVGDFLIRLPGRNKAIITSRRVSGDGSIGVRIGPLTADQSAQVIQKLVEHDEISISYRLAEEIHNLSGGIPLAIVLIVGLIRRRQGMAEEIIQKFKGRPESMTKLLDFCLKESYLSLDDNAKTLLKYITLFHEKSTPSQKLLPIISDIVNEFALDNAINQLLDLCLIVDEGTRWAVHPLTKMFVRNQTSANERHLFSSRYASYIQSIDREKSIYVFTRDYELKRIPGTKPTALDLAFSIHSNVALRFGSASINGELANEDHILKTGDMVDIQTTDKFHILTDDWLVKVTTDSARKKIKTIKTKQLYDQDRIDAKIRRGNVEALRGRMYEALQKFEDANLSQPSLTWTHNRLGHSYRMIGSYEKAIKQHTVALEIDKDNPFALAGLAAVYYTLGDTEKAEAFFRSAISIKKDYVNAMFGLGRVYSCTNKYPKAEAQYLRALRIEQQSPRIQLYLSIVAALQEKQNLALTSLEQALKLFYKYRKIEGLSIVYGTHPLYYYTIGLVLANSDNFSKYLERALSICSHKGMIDEINRDIGFISERALHLYDIIALPDSVRTRNAQQRLNYFKKSLL